MKVIFTLVGFILLAISSPAQTNCYLYGGTPGPATTVTLRNDSIRHPDPLLVIDGLPFKLDELGKINPNDIASIDILKASDFPVFCNRALSDIIVITTKRFYQKEFAVKDFFTGEKIPGATISFLAKGDSIKAVADDNGILITDKLKSSVEYSVTVSSVGYKTFSTVIAGKNQEFLLERDIKECGQVVVSATDCPRKISCGGSFVVIKGSSVQAGASKIRRVSVYPNPVQRNNLVNLGFESEQDELIQVVVVGMNGVLVTAQLKKATKGSNLFSISADAKWAAGIYNIQLRNEKGTLVRQEKLIVQ